VTLTDPHAFIVAGQELTPPPGLEVTNFMHDDVLEFEGRDRPGRTVNELVIHESVTR